MYDYFYGAESEQFSFYRIPKVLFTEERFKAISAEAKVLYGLLLDRMSLSAKNGWQDKENRVYIIFTIEDIMEAMGCADQKAGKLLYELESKCGLIERKRQGLGKPNLIYVKNFVTPSESRFLNRENHDSGEVKITDQEPLKSRSNNTENNNTERSDTDSFPFTSFREDHGRESKRSDVNQRDRYREIISENISYGILFPVKLTLSKDMDKELRELQKQFMPEDTKAGLIQSFLDNYNGTQVCSKLIYAEALNHPFDEPKQWEIREINEIMNNSIEGWTPFSNPRIFAKYGRQRGWERIPLSGNELTATGSNLPDGFRELTEEEARQMELPF